jgi:serine/threonine protein kinase
MSPEVAEHKPYNQGADVYSFGIVLGEILFLSYPIPRYENGLINTTCIELKDMWPDCITNVMMSCLSPVIRARPKMEDVQVALRISISQLSTRKG